MSWYKESFRKVAQATYTKRALVEVHRENIGTESIDIEDAYAYIPFSIDVDYREWGIKDVSISASETIVVDFEVVEWNEEGNTTESIKQIPIDLGALRVDSIHYDNSAYTVDSLSLELNANYEVDYDKSYIYFVKG